MKVDALQAVIDSLKADGGELKDKLRSEKNLSQTREKYMANLELRFSDLCDECKAKTPGTAFSTQENYALTKITKLLEEQSREMSALKSKLENGALGAPGAGDTVSESTSETRAPTDSNL